MYPKVFRRENLYYTYGSYLVPRYTRHNSEIQACIELRRHSELESRIMRLSNYEI